MSSIETYMAFGIPGTWEWLVIAMIGLLLFGKRLPEVGKSLGKSIVEFKKGLKGVEDDIDRSIEADQSDMLPPPNDKVSSDDKSSNDKSTQQEEAATPSNSSASSD